MYEMLYKLLQMLYTRISTDNMHCLRPLPGSVSQVCCSVFQRVAVRCSVLPCHVFQETATAGSV